MRISCGLAERTQSRARVYPLPPLPKALHSVAVHRSLWRYLLQYSSRERPPICNLGEDHGRNCIMQIERGPYTVHTILSGLAPENTEKKSIT